MKFKFPSRRPADIVCVGAISNRWLAFPVRGGGLGLTRSDFNRWLASHVDTKADRQNYTRFFNLSYRFNFAKLLSLQQSMIQ
ncbi:hypothetical protein [Microcoleus sp. bin38.metabat.b11b12b14.051]|uniref:hypothetical protein n=1 Tax=Microcoleus sp. bin38.metabat.b11b12b14.051 TaxID=2742709 RepID=UPI0025E4EA19|nr:hypothetical protein [Microcoleus sp. bin38.metabat.b11b12b14.051]